MRPLIPPPARGDWTPLLPERTRLILAWLVALVPVTFGIDYLLHTHQGDHRLSLTIVESQAPMWVWGTICMAGGLLMMAGIALRWTRIVVLGSLISAAVLTTIAIGRAVAISERPFLDGISVPITMGVVAAACWGFAIGFAIKGEDDK